MVLQRIIGIIEGFASGSEFRPESTNGQIYITDPEWDALIQAFESGDKNEVSLALASKLGEIAELNRRLQMEIMDDPEPIEDALLQKCHEFLKSCC